RLFGDKISVLQKLQRGLLHLRVAQQQCMDSVNYQKVSRTRQLGLFDRNDKVVVAGEQRIVAVGVLFAAGDYAKLRLWDSEVLLELFPFLAHLLTRLARNAFEHRASPDKLGHPGAVVRRADHYDPLNARIGQHSVVIHRAGQVTADDNVAQAVRDEVDLVDLITEILNDLRKRVG